MLLISSTSMIYLCRSATQESCRTMERLRLGAFL